MEVCPYSYLLWYGYCPGLWVSFVTTWVFSEGHKNYFKDWCLINSQPNSNFVECISFLESNSPDILALCETKLDDSIDSGSLSVRVYLPLIRRDSLTRIHGLAVYVKEGLPFSRDLPLENSEDSYLCFWLALLYSVSYFFLLNDNLLCCYARFWFYFI